MQPDSLLSGGTDGPLRLSNLNPAGLRRFREAVGEDITEDEVFIAVLPFFHIYGMQVLMNTGLRAGATIVTMPRFDLQQFLQLHQDHGITRSFVAPPIVVALAKHPLVDEYDLSKVQQIFSGAAPLSESRPLQAR